MFYVCAMSAYDVVQIVRLLFICSLFFCYINLIRRPVTTLRYTRASSDDPKGLQFAINFDGSRGISHVHI